jgi:hypothetical protein
LARRVLLRPRMLDLILVCACAAFFALSWAYVGAVEKL